MDEYDVEEFDKFVERVWGNNKKETVTATSKRGRKAKNI